MDERLRKLTSVLVLKRYKLPYKGIEKSKITTLQDYCLQADDENISKLIYEGIISYAFSSTEIDIKNLDNHQKAALKSRIKYNEEASDETKQKYGFYGEVMLHAILLHFFATNKIIARGHFYSPSSQAEITGFDSYHYYENKNNQIELWFGEAKMYSSFVLALKNVLKEMDKVLSNDYLDKNIRTISNRKNDLEKSNVSDLFTSFYYKMLKNELDFKKEMKENNLKIIFPVFILYDANQNLDYDEKISNAINTINKNVENRIIKNEVNADILFVLLPLKSVKEIKRQVIEWIFNQKSII